MSEAYEIWEKPDAEQVYLLAGWRQWADAGSVSSGLPQYLVQQLKAKKIGKINPDGFYLFQIPGTHDLVRPIVRYNEGFPESLKTQRNDLYYTANGDKGLVIFSGDEPHMDAERYVNTLLDVAQLLGVQRIVTLGGVYGELPYDKERMISSVYSMRKMKAEINRLAVNLSDYHGGASIGSYICRRAGERNMESVGLYAFVPLYDFSALTQVNSSIRVENDFTAWLGILRRVNYMLNLKLDLTDLEHRHQQLLESMDKKIDELDHASPEAGVRAYVLKLAEEFNETPFEPLDELWEEELRRLFDKFPGENESSN
jgi:proteasome assembly chaperone (PAC2) family protein